MSSTSTSLVSSPSRALAQIPTSRTLQTPQRPVSTPSTPVAKPSTPTQSPGNFRHPRLTEIISRQHKVIFDESNIRSATINATAIILSFYFSHDIHNALTALLSMLGLVTASTAASITSTTILILRILFLTNAVLALRPILPYISQKDDIADIPLTPSQRKLLGLPPSAPITPLSTTSSPNAGTSGYVTPPRYQRHFSGSNASTPASQAQNYSADRRSMSANYSTSPLSTSRYTLGFSPSPSAPQTQPRTRTASGSPFSPTASPLFQKAVRQQHTTAQDIDLGVSGRSSIGQLNQSSYGGSTSVFGRSSLGLGRSQSVKERGSRELPQGSDARGSPIAQKGVNYKWLYDKGYTGPGSGLGRSGMVKSESMGF